MLCEFKLQSVENFREGFARLLNSLGERHDAGHEQDRVASPARVHAPIPKGQDRIAVHLVACGRSLLLVDAYRSERTVEVAQPCSVVSSVNTSGPLALGLVQEVTGLPDTAEVINAVVVEHSVPSKYIISQKVNKEMPIPDIEPKFTYERFVISKSDENLEYLLGKFIHASTQEIVRNDDKNIKYRLLHSEDTERLYHIYQFIDDIDESNHIVSMNDMVLIPVEFLDRPKIPDGL